MISMAACMLIACNRRFEFSPFTVISVENQMQKEVAEWFAWLFAAPGGFVPMVVTDAPSADVILRNDPGMPDASYRLDIDRNTINISASGISGFFCAFRTIRDMLPDEIDSIRHADSVRWTVPSVRMSEASGIDGLELLWQEDFDSFDDSKWSRNSHGPAGFLSGNRKNPLHSVTASIRPDTYNVYSVEILPDNLVFFVNGKKTLTYPRIETGEDHRVQYPFGSPYYILMDMQIGGNRVGPADRSDIPVGMTIDRIRTCSLE